MTGTLFQGSNRPLWLATASALALLATPVAAQSGTEPPSVEAAQGAPDLQTPNVSATSTDAPDVAGEQQVGFAADNLNYDSDADIVVADGNVQMNREAIQMRADKVTWNRKTGEVVAEGDVAITNPEGDTAYGDRIVLTDSLRDGVVEDMLVVLDNGSRLAAVKGTRFENGNIELENAAYTPCPVEDDAGCARNPSWQVRAVKVMYDKAKNKVRYKGARIEIFGLPLIPLPGLSHPLNSEASSGLLVPEIRLDRTNGFEIAIPYYLRIAPDRDATITPHLYTGAAPMIEGEFRGYLESVGKFQLSPHWSISYSGRIASDRTFLRRYDITRDDRLRSSFEIERIGGQSYLSIAGWATQTLRAGDKQGQQPIALPIIDYRQRLTDPVFGGPFELQLNTLAIGRTAGQDTQRAFAGVRWDLRRLTSLGQEVTLTAMVRGDVYHSDENLLTAIPGYRGKSGWEGRGIAAVAADMRWPFVGEFLGGTQTLTPRIQFVATPPLKNLDIPNEDSRAFDLEDSNLFAINRFNGYDRFEDGVRVT